MNRKYSIGFIILLLTILVFVSAAYEFSYKAAVEKAREEKLVEYQKSVQEDALKTEGNAIKSDCYYLMEEHGYVVVYLSDKKTLFEYTSILVENLPTNLKEEIKNGKYIDNQEELYGFLENYSS